MRTLAEPLEPPAVRKDFCPLISALLLLSLQDVAASKLIVRTGCLEIQSGVCVDKLMVLLT